MFNFNALITFIMGAATFLTGNLNAALKFTSQKLLAAPQAHFQESVTVIIPVTLTTTITSAAQAFTSSIASPGNELAVVHNPLPSGNISFFAALKEIICVLYALLRLSPDAATLVSAFLFAVLLLALIVCFFDSSAPAMKPQDLIHLEAQVNAKDELLQQLRTSYAADRAELRRSLQVQRDEADKRLSDASAQHRSALASKDQQIRELCDELASADLREEKARFEASDEVFKLNKEIDELVAGAEKAQEKVKAAEERVIAAGQRAIEAKQKVQAAEKAQEEVKVAGERTLTAAIAAERKNGQAAVDRVKAEARELLDKARDDLRVEQYRVQDLKKDMAELKAGVAVGAAAHVLMPTVLESSSSASQAEEIRKRLEKVPVPVVSGALSMPGPAPAFAGSPVAVPGPSAPAEQPGVIRRPRVRGPFAPIQRGKNSKRG
ncbi:unnamed protein product [Aureobasidium mustum]|uniref:Uncharacterized protein n=1 Tax=Aureobasidium mustum TaxID=2773714 RepID=A0A9N8K9M3_9PEZI|nr:unnamed protein product [Aureobasidium mustum]